MPRGKAGGENVMSRFLSASGREEPGGECGGATTTGRTGAEGTNSGEGLRARFLPVSLCSGLREHGAWLSLTGDRL